MFRHSKPLSLIAITASVFVLNACVIPPPNQNYNPGQGYNQPNYGSAPVNVSDLYNTTENYAKQQLSQRGFRQVDEKWSGGFNNTYWYNGNTQQCFILESADGKVMTLNPATPGAKCGVQGGQPGYGQNQPSGSLPPAAESACFNRFSEPGYQRIKQVSPLKPGYWEVIILGKNGRQVACTVDQNGVISDWVNM